MKKIYALFILLISVSSASAQCMASFEVTTNSNEVTATITGTGAISPFYTIDWGDGSNADFAQSATHFYANPGTYTITWIYSDLTNPGCTQTATQDIIITGGGCTLNYTPFAVGLAVTFQVASENTSVPVYTINWGDGSPEEQTDQAFHQYATEGTYTICVSMVDLDNPEFCNIESCQDVTIVEQSGDCTVELSVVVDGTTVSASAVGIGATIENYVIAWGDNTISNSANANHVYAIAGTYNVCVYYGDLSPGGCQVSDCQEVVAEAGSGDCTLEITPTAIGLNVALTANGVGAETPEYTIDWGDGSASENTVPAFHAYAAAGTYLICVSYIDMANLENCQVNQCQEIVLEEVSTDCTLDITVEASGNVVDVVAVGTGAGSPQYAIQWGDATFPTLGSEGSHTYTAGGAYQVCVTYLDVDNITGCNVTECETVNITVGVENGSSIVEQVGVTPNPLTENSSLLFSLSRPTWVVADIYDLVGNKVFNITNGSYGQGSQRVNWNSSSLSSGVYFVKVKTDRDEKTIRVIR